MTVNIDTSDLNDLRIARSLLRTKHLARSASELEKSPSAMSHALRRLRKQFGDELLVRQGREWVLTPLALELREELERTFAALERLSQAGVGFEPETSQRRFVIATVDYTEMVLLPLIFAQLRGLAPGCALDVVRPSDVEKELELGRVDLLLAPEFELPHDRLIMQKLLTDELVLVGSEESLEAARDADSFAAAAQGLVSPTGKLRTEVDESLEALGRTRHIKLSSPSFIMPAIAAVGSDIIIAMPRRLAAIFAPKLGLGISAHPVIRTRFTLAMIWHPKMRSDEGHRWIRELVISESKKLAVTACTSSDPAASDPNSRP